MSFTKNLNLYDHGCGIFENKAANVHAPESAPPCLANVKWTQVMIRVLLKILPSILLVYGRLRIPIECQKQRSV